MALAALVLVTALAVPPGAAAALAWDRIRLLVVLVVAAVVLPALGWVASRLVADQVLRRGVLALGVAPAEVASVATVSVAGGDTAAAAGLLIGSTLLTVVLAGPVLGLLGGSAGVDVGSVLVNLVLVIAAPLVVGLAVRNRVARGPARHRLETVGPVALVTVLVYLVASEVRFTRAYVGVVGALVVFLVGSTALGAMFGRRGGPAVGHRGVADHRHARLRHRRRHRHRRLRRGLGRSARDLRRAGHPLGPGHRRGPATSILGVRVGPSARLGGRGGGGSSCRDPWMRGSCPDGPARGFADHGGSARVHR